VPTKVVDQGNELVDVSTPKKHPSTLPPLFKSLVVQKVVIMNELNSRSKGGEENDANGDESISEPRMEHTKEEPKDPYGDEVAKHPTKKPKNSSIVVTNKSKNIVKGGSSKVKKGKHKKRLIA